MSLSRTGCGLLVLLLALGIAHVYTVPILTPTSKGAHRSEGAAPSARVHHARRSTHRSSSVASSLPRFAELHSESQRPSHARHHSAHRFQATGSSNASTTPAALPSSTPDAFTLSGGVYSSIRACVAACGCCTRGALMLSGLTFVCLFNSLPEGDHS